MYLDSIKPHIHMPPSFLISVLIVAFLWPMLLPAGVRGSDPYQGCGDSFDCGNRTGIGYPFWLSGWPKYCGHPSFALDCDGEKLTLSYGNLSYRVNDIDASAQILKVSRTDLFSSLCTHADGRNTSFNTSVFEYTPSDSFVNVLYDCYPPNLNAQGGTTAGWLHHFTCAGIDNNFVAISQQPPDQAITGTCETVIQVPVMNTSKILKWDFSHDAMWEAFVNGFELHWIDENKGKCEACRNSNGTCIYDLELEEFKCHCHDGTVSKNTCRSNGQNGGEVQLLSLENGHGGPVASNGFLVEKTVNPQDLLLMRLNVVCMATGNFSDENKLGRGGFGTVYKGVLPDGREIAVKRLSRNSGQGIIELKNEVTLIARLQHQNIVRLLGCSLEEHEKLLIYEYMPNKSLDFFLFDPRMSGVLCWKRRVCIINGIARGLLYLHEDSRLRIIHRDLKASNVLLDQEMNAKISDFGMARIFSIHQDEASTNRIIGTYGYMAPEYAVGGHFSVKSDVYSFGVLLLETVSGRKNNSFDYHEPGKRSLLDFTWKLWNDGQALDLIDHSIRESRDDVRVLKCIHIGLLCVQEDPASRPTMSLIIHMLRDETTVLPRPLRPAFSIGRPHETELAREHPQKDPSTVNGLSLSWISPR
ncbi:hypothetical protein MLD38_030130 [Melastoma candidum]|uniref:Uncharacterized protein n=1 Tax=Melastoma candidum TaxID=119954 RepID=A0ACB9MLY9_9MYRT|nr:hypothetical protein MLD38_030130 [Melastoma candidum]